MIGIKATATTPTLAAWQAKLAGGVAQRIATRSATRMQTRAREEAPVDTGSLHVSISVTTPTTSDYGENVSDAGGLRPDATYFPAPATPGPDSAVVAVGAEYGDLVNNGTLHMPARPFWDTARLETEQALAADAAAEWSA